MKELIKGCLITTSSLVMVFVIQTVTFAADEKTPEEILVDMGYEEIHQPPSPLHGSYLYASRVGKIVYLTAAAPEDVNGLFGEPGKFIEGKFGEEFSGDAKGALIAELSCLRLLRFLKTEIGELDQVKRIVRINANLLTTSDYTDISPVANGCSDFLVKVFGKERGLHARVVGGKAAHPFGLAMMIDAIVELK